MDHVCYHIAHAAQVSSERKWLFEVPCLDFISESRHHHFIATGHHDGELGNTRKNIQPSMIYCAGQGMGVWYSEKCGLDMDRNF
jgi:hypothetical protein